MTERAKPMLEEAKEGKRFKHPPKEEEEEEQQDSSKGS
jgi:hypothetical protein